MPRDLRQSRPGDCCRSAQVPQRGTASSHRAPGPGHPAGGTQREEEAEARQGQVGHCHCFDLGQQDHGRQEWQEGKRRRGARQPEEAEATWQVVEHSSASSTFSSSHLRHIRVTFAAGSLYGGPLASDLQLGVHMTDAQGKWKRRTSYRSIERSRGSRVVPMAAWPTLETQEGECARSSSSVVDIAMRVSGESEDKTRCRRVLIS
jgi:hypothetical protein